MKGTYHCIRHVGPLDGRKYTSDRAPRFAKCTNPPDTSICSEVLGNCTLLPPSLPSDKAKVDAEGVS